MQFDGNSMTDAGLINRLDALLPQTQCRRCGYAACRPYAEAMAAGKAGANQCPPGGDTLARALAIELGIDYAPLDRKYGEHSLAAVARIDEASCIGCALCIKACPVDAIVGAAKYMHTVITAACTGCELCLPPCPVDCISMMPVAVPEDDERREAARRARKSFDAREIRLARIRAQNENETAIKAAAARKRHAVRLAVEKARARIAKKPPPL
jgi:electron transport complex protein RnfB